MTLPAMSRTPQLSPCPDPTVPFWLDPDAFPPHLQRWVWGIGPAVEKDEVHHHTLSAPLPASVDVVVIGSGLSGASVCHHLLQGPHHPPTVLLLDARGLCQGATGRNGGFLYAHDWREIPSLAADTGWWSAFRIVWFEQLNKRSLRRLADGWGVSTRLGTVRDKKFQYDSRDITGIELFRSSADLAERLSGLEASVLAWSLARRILGVEWWVGESLGHHMYTGKAEVGTQQPGLHSSVVLRQHSDSFWPAKLVLEMIFRAASKGLCVRTNCTVEAVQELPAPSDSLSSTRSLATDTQAAVSPRRYQVLTSRGDVKCDAVVYATNAWTGGLLPRLFGERIVPALNHVACTVPLPALLKLPTVSTKTDEFVHCAGFDVWPGYHYFMQRPCGRVILGGFRDVTPGKGIGNARDDKVIPSVVSHMNRFLPQLFPSLPITKVADGSMLERVWTGVIGWSYDDAPWVGSIASLRRDANNIQPDRAHARRGGEYVCAGFSGHGMSRAFLCGASVADMVCRDLSVDVTSTSWFSRWLRAPPPSFLVAPSRSRTVDWQAVS